ncbi:MAG: BON domain-containing protein, partial [Gemmatimonadota bacterium]
MPNDYEDLFDVDDMDDEEIEDLILEEFDTYPELDADVLDVRVEDGFVTLAGRVGTEEELQLVEHVVSDLLGIANYSNEVIVAELARAEYDEAADVAATEDAETEDELGENGRTTDPSADHLVEDLEGELYGTHDLQKAIERGMTYEPPDRPVQEGTWSE